mgnify:CR=1 FL=1
MTLILPPDIEAFLCDYLRTHITDVDGLQVGSKKPPDYQGAYPLVTVRDDGGNADGLGHFDRSIGVNVYGWSRQAEKPCKDLARRVYAALTEHPAIASPRIRRSSAWTIPRATGPTRCPTIPTPRTTT